MAIKINPRFAMLAGIQGAQAGLAQRPTGKAERRPRKAKVAEEVTQDLCEKYLNALGLKWFHMPAYVLRAAFGWKENRTGGEFHAMKDAKEIVKGLPDLLIFDRGRYLAIELKTEAKGSELTATQRQWRAAIGTHEARSFEAAKAIIDAWRAGLPLPPPNTKGLDP